MSRTHLTNVLAHAPLPLTARGSGAESRGSLRSRISRESGVAFLGLSENEDAIEDDVPFPETGLIDIPASQFPLDEETEKVGNLDGEQNQMAGISIQAWKVLELVRQQAASPSGVPDEPIMTVSCA
jgi:hypothetical protein